MGAVLLRVRSDLRSHWETWAALALLVGLMGGAVTAAAAGARRTDSAFGRFLTSTRAPDVFTFTNGADPSFAQIPDEEISHFPQVAAAAQASDYAVVDPVDAAVIASPDTRAGSLVLRHKMLAGRRPRPDRADEVMVSFTLADRHRIHVGDRLEVTLAATDEQATPTGFSFRVVGIEASANEFPPQTGTGVNNIWATPAFFHDTGDSIISYDTVMLRLRRGSADVPALEREVQQRGGGKPASVFALSDQAVNTQHSIHLQAVALWLLAGLLAFAGVLVAAQLLVRQSHLESGEDPSLRALGASRAQLVAIGMARALVIGVLGAAVALAVALALSALTPVGVARTAEPHPGFAADALALSLGALGTLALVATIGGGAVWRATRAPVPGQGPVRAGRTGTSKVAEALSRGSAPVPVTAGVRMALEPGRGGTAVPVRSTLTGAVIGVVALATALAFSASLDHLLATPRLYGANWDARVTPNGGDDVSPAVPAVQADPDVVDAAIGYTAFPVAIGRLRVDGIAVEALQGDSLQPAPVQGRLPTGPGEVVMGRVTMNDLGAHIGSTVRATVADATPEPVPLRVVGVAVFPALSDAMGLGKGLAMTPDGLRRMIPGGSVPPPDTIVVRFRSGARTAGATAALQRRVSSVGSFSSLSPERPVDLVNFGQVQALPLVLGGLLGLFAAATLAHLLVTSIRRRRRDLAILKTLGLVPGQVAATVAWQATTLSVVAVVVGVPLGVAAGRSVWLLFAHQLGIEPEPVYPLLALAVLAVGTLTVANLVAALPARWAGRTSAAVVLRSE
jgi:ABC-type lipoprotein release transport system permease subunit